MLRKKIGYLGFLGFVGFQAFGYFQSHNIVDLSFLAYFGFFAYFWIAKMSVSIPDERYVENTKLAKSFAFNIALIEIVALFLLGVFVPISREFLLAGISFCFASLLIIYAVKLYTLEEK